MERPRAAAVPFYQQSHLPNPSTSAQRHILTLNVFVRRILSIGQSFIFGTQDYIRLRTEKLNIVTWMHTVVDKRIRGLVGGQMGQIGMRTEMPPPRQLRNGIPATT